MFPKKEYGDALIVTHSAEDILQICVVYVGEKAK